MLSKRLEGKVAIVTVQNTISRLFNDLLCTGIVFVQLRYL